MLLDVNLATLLKNLWRCKMPGLPRREIRYSIHIPKTDYRDDCHYVKEKIFNEDGTTIANAYLLKDFQRSVYVTTKSKRNHVEKKEFEHKDNLFSRLTTQSDINKTVAMMLDAPHIAKNRNAIKESPYVYGYDITSTSLLKYSSLKRNEFIQSPYTVSAFDIETSMVDGHILMATLALDGKCYTSILKSFVAGYNNPEYLIRKAVEKYLPQYKDLECIFTFHDTEVDMLKEIFKVANDEAPDFMAIWNMNFDIPKVLERLEANHVNPIDVICDQDVPREYRVCRYKEGIKKKVTASGVVKPINPSLRWHTLFATSKFYVIDSMCVYRQLRLAEQEKPSYSLDNILKAELNTQKLKFTEADGLSGGSWHEFMQSKHPIEYVVYNMYDCLSMLELDNKLKDLKSTLPSAAGITDFFNFNKTISILNNSLFLFGLSKDLVIGTTPVTNDEEINTDDLDDDDPDKYNTLNLKNWIQLLPQNQLLNRGLKVLEDYPELRTNIRGLTADFDSTSSYPSCTKVANVSKKTCTKEIIKIEHVPERVFREQNMSINLGASNSLEYFNIMFNLPKLSDLDEVIDKYTSELN